MLIKIYEAIQSIEKLSIFAAMAPVGSKIEALAEVAVGRVWKGEKGRFAKPVFSPKSGRCPAMSFSWKDLIAIGISRHRRGPCRL